MHARRARLELAVLTWSVYVLPVVRLPSEQPCMRGLEARLRAEKPSVLACHLARRPALSLKIIAVCMYLVARGESVCVRPHSQRSFQRSIDIMAALSYTLQASDDARLLACWPAYLHVCAHTESSIRKEAASAIYASTRIMNNELV